MKKFLKLLFSFVLGCLACLTPFIGKINFATAAGTVSENDYSTKLDVLFKNLAITQDGYVFGKNDFADVDINADDKTELCLYVNSTITFTNITYNSVMVVNISPFGGGLNDNRTLTPYGTNTTYYSALDYEGTTEKIYEIRIIQRISPNEEQLLFFYLIQSPNRFSTTPAYTWTNNEGKAIITPNPSVAYTDYISLNNVRGTTACPIYIDFYFNGEFYSIYNINGRFYNNLTGNKLDLDINGNNNEILKFNVPGKYEAFIYDRTCYNALKFVTFEKDTENEVTLKIYDKSSTNYSPYTKADSFSFTIEQGESNRNKDNVYIIATLEDKSAVVSNQSVNQDVYINFYNLQETANYSDDIEKINVVKHYSTISGDTVSGEYINTVTNLYPTVYKKLSTLSNESVKFTDDGIYEIIIYFDKYDSDGKQVTKQFNFNILKDVHSSFGDLYAIDKKLVPDNNKIYNIDQYHTIITTYAGITELVPSATDPLVTTPKKLESKTSTYFSVKLARANTTIEGVKNNESVKDSLNLAVSGVGEIVVTINKDGSNTYKTMSGGGSLSISEVGEYTVTIKDEMGFTASRTFTITRSLNAATIALIAIGGVALFAFILIVFKLRRKIKVR